MVRIPAVVQFLRILGQELLGFSARCLCEDKRIHVHQTGARERKHIPTRGGQEYKHRRGFVNRAAPRV